MRDSLRLLFADPRLQWRRIQEACPTRKLGQASLSVDAFCQTVVAITVCCCGALMRLCGGLLTAGGPLAAVVVVDAGRTRADVEQFRLTLCLLLSLRVRAPTLVGADGRQGETRTCTSRGSACRTQRVSWRMLAALFSLR